MLIATRGYISYFPMLSGDLTHYDSGGNHDITQYGKIIQQDLKTNGFKVLLYPGKLEISW